MNPFGAMIVIQDLARLGETLLNLIPYPGCAVANDTQPHLIVWNQPSLFDAIQSLPDGVIILNLMPAQGIYDALGVKGVQPYALGVFIAAFPARPPSSTAFGRVDQLT